MWRNEEWKTGYVHFFFSVICCKLVPEHHKFFFRLVLTACLGREVFSTLDAGIPPVCLPGSTCNLLGLFRDYNKVFRSLCSTLCQLSSRRFYSHDTAKCKQRRQIPEAPERKNWWGQGQWHKQCLRLGFVLCCCDVFNAEKTGSKKPEGSIEIWQYLLPPARPEISCHLPYFREVTGIDTDQGRKNAPPSFNVCILSL